MLTQCTRMQMVSHSSPSVLCVLDLCNLDFQYLVSFLKMIYARLNTNVHLGCILLGLMKFDVVLFSF